VGARSRAKLTFAVDGVWRGVGDRSTAELSGVVTEAGTDRRLPVTGTLAVRLGRVVHVDLHLHFGTGQIVAGHAVDLAPTSLDRIVGQAHDLLGQVWHLVGGQVSLPGRLHGGDLEPEDVEVSIDLRRVLQVALRAVH
jgi:hypothetical protein